MKALLTILTLFFINLTYAQVRMVEMTWSPIPEAMAYELKLYQNSGSQYQEMGIEKVNATFWSKALNPGEYAFEIRALDYRNVPGVWGKKQHFKVSLPSVKQVAPAQQQSFDLIEDDKLVVDLVWEEIPETASYHIHVQDEAGKLLLNKSLKETSSSIPLERPGKYFWKVTALASNDKTPALGTMDKFFIVYPPRLIAPFAALKNQQNNVKIEWQAHKQSIKEKVTVSYFDDGKWLPVISEEVTGKKELFIPKSKLKKGQYRIRLVSFDSTKRPSEASVLDYQWDEQNAHAGPIMTQSPNKFNNERFGQTPWAIEMGVSNITATFQNQISKNDTLIQGGYVANGYNAKFYRQLANSQHQWITQTSLYNAMNQENNWLLLNLSSQMRYTIKKNIHSFEIDYGLSYRDLPFSAGNVQNNDKTQADKLGIGSALIALGYGYAINDRHHVNARLTNAFNLLSLNNPTGNSLSPTTSQHITVGYRYELNQNIDTRFSMGFFNEEFTLSKDQQQYQGQELAFAININF
jgi:hypothetical protein